MPYNFSFLFSNIYPCFFKHFDNFLQNFLYFYIDYYLKTKILQVGCKMGETLSRQKQENIQILSFISDLTLIGKLENSIFGQLTIYKMQQKPYEYIMRKTYSGLENDTTLEEKQRFFKTDSWGKCQALVIPDFIKLTKKESICGKYLELDLFCRYYFFTLQDMIAKKKKDGRIFQADEIFYVISTLLEVLRQAYLRKNEPTNLFKTQKIFLTPQGALKVYPYINLWLEQASRQTQLEQQSICSIAPSSQVNISIQSKTVYNEIILERIVQNDLQDLGFLVFRLISLTWSPQQFCDNQEQKLSEFLKVDNYNHNLTIQIAKKFIQALLIQKLPINELQAFMKNLACEKNIPKIKHLKIMDLLQNGSTSSNNTSILETNTKYHKTKQLNLHNQDSKMKEQRCFMNEKKRSKPGGGGLSRIKRQ